VKTIEHCNGREFQVWACDIGHSQLLLRSVKTEEQPTRIDVMFKNVELMNMCCVLENLTIEKARLEDVGLENYCSKFGNRIVYRLVAKDYVGFVLAGAMSTAVDEGEYDEPSSIFPM
jgi:hypothetical protein